MDYITVKWWLLVISVLAVFLAHFVYRLITGESLEEAVRRGRQEPPQD